VPHSLPYLRSQKYSYNPGNLTIIYPVEQRFSSNPTYSLTPAPR
jgi:hypothetical protein